MPHNDGPEEMGNVIAKCVQDIERYTQYNSFDQINSILQYMCVEWQTVLYGYFNGRKMSKNGKKISKYLCMMQFNSQKDNNLGNHVKKC